MTFWTFLKSVPGKITMVATTAIAGIAANFTGASMVKEDLEMEALKKGIVEGGGTISGLTDTEIMAAYDALVTDVNNGVVSGGTAQKIIDCVSDNLSHVDFDSHFQTLPVGLTIAAVAVLGIVWFLLYRHAKKMA